MRCRFKFLVLFLILSSAIAANAQAPDTTFIEEIDTASINNSYSESNEENTETTASEEPPAPIIYNDKKPTESQWQSITSDKAYGYKNTVEYVEVDKPDKKPPLLWLLLLKIYSFFISAIGRIILIALLIGIVGYILYRILTGEGRNLFSKKNESMEETNAIITEDDLFTSNWETRLQLAMKDGDMRLAIRYSYLMLLQMMQARDLIQYRQDKTNTEYYRELSGSDYRLPFRQLSRQYEATWYGAYLPSAQAFSEYMEAFNGIKNKIGNR